MNKRIYDPRDLSTSDLLADAAGLINRFIAVDTPLTNKEARELRAMIIAWFESTIDGFKWEEPERYSIQELLDSSPLPPHSS
jgi:hypothetical protein